MDKIWSQISGSSPQADASVARIRSIGQWPVVPRLQSPAPALDSQRVRS